MRQLRTPAATFVVALLAVAAILSSCGQSQPVAVPPMPGLDPVESDATTTTTTTTTTIEEPPTPSPPAMWDRTLGEISPEGEVDLQVALECPGAADRPAAQQMGDGAVVAVASGTDAASISVVGLDHGCEQAGEGGGGAASDDVDECLVGTWVAYAVAMQDTTTGMPATSLGGGEGTVLEIEADGSFTMDFDDSTPVLSDVGGFQMGHQTRGVAHGRLTASNGQLAVVEQDYASSLRTKFVGAVGGGPEQAGGIGIGTGTYECTSNSLDTEEPTELGRNVFLFEST